MGTRNDLQGSGFSNDEVGRLRRAEADRSSWRNRLVQLCIVFAILYQDILNSVRGNNNYERLKQVLDEEFVRICQDVVVMKV